MSHQPNWVFNPEENAWEDENQPDSDQFSGTVGEWTNLLIREGNFPPLAELKRGSKR